MEFAVYVTEQSTLFCGKIPIEPSCIHLYKAKRSGVSRRTIFVLRRGPEKEIWLRESDAFLYIFDNLPRYRWLSRIGQRFPAPFRDAVYRLIAATRYLILGKRDTCRLPTPAERARFLP